MEINNIGLIGLGFVGTALKNTFELKGVKVATYDKYKKDFSNFNNILNSKYIFFCLPTPSNDSGYDLSSIIENLDLLQLSSFKGTVIIKSTVLPGTCKSLSASYSFDIIHNPEFLTERTAFEDFFNQSHIVIGHTSSVDYNIINFYMTHFPYAKISSCTSDESESMKIMCNSFYAMKVQIFNEFYNHCNNLNIDYNNVVKLMLANNWINPMHTKVPGSDGKLSYGGHCFPKDTEALLAQMKERSSLHSVLEAVVKERAILRND